MFYVLLRVTLCPILVLRKRELVALLTLISWRFVIVALPEVPQVCLQFVIVVFPDHTIFGMGYEFVDNFAYSCCSIN